MRKLSLLCVLSFAAASTVALITPQPAGAVAGSQFNAGRIIDDVVFFSNNTMGPTEIQNFLNAKVPVCDTWHAGSGGNQPPFTCLKDYRQDTPARSAEAGLCNGFGAGNKSAAQIIYEVGQSCGINPQVMIVLLQKEQSLITDTWPWSNQYRSATGYGCPDTAPCDAEYYGFFNQVYSAARQFRRYARDPQLFSYRMGRNNYIQYNPNASCGGTNVYIQNQATAGLYNYTPYQPNASALNNLYGSGDSCGAYGNRNFWRMFNDWFGTPVIGAVPSPLYKSSSSQSIYVIAGGRRFLVPSPAVLVNYGLHTLPAAQVDDSFINQYASGGSLASMGKKELDPSGTLYLFDDGKRYPIGIGACAKMPDGSPIPTTSWGLDCFNGAVSKTLANELVDLYTVQDIPIPTVILNGDGVWKLEGGKKRRITSPVFVDVLGGWGNARWMKDINAQQPQGKLLILENMLVKLDNDPVLYLFADQRLHPIAGPAELSASGLIKKPPLMFPGAYNANDPLSISSAMVGFYAKDSAGKPYVLTGGSKIEVTGNATDWPVAQAHSLPDSFLGTVPNRPLPRVFRSDIFGTIFTVFNAKKYIFATTDDFLRLGFRPEEIQSVEQGIENTLSYGGLHLASGRLYKIAGSHTIYLVNGVHSLIVPSTSYPGLPYEKLITVDSTTAARYPVAGTYHP